MGRCDPCPGAPRDAPLIPSEPTKASPCQHGAADPVPTDPSRVINACRTPGRWEPRQRFGEHTLCPKPGSAGGETPPPFGGQISPWSQPGETVHSWSKPFLLGFTPGGLESAGAKPDPRAEAQTPAAAGSARPGRAGGDGSQGPVGPGCCRTAASRNARRGTRGDARPPRAFQLL